VLEQRRVVKLFGNKKPAEAGYLRGSQISGYFQRRPVSLGMLEYGNFGIWDNGRLSAPSSVFSKFLISDNNFFVMSFD
jgi:hypothetical protein